MARELGYKEGSGVHVVVKRLEGRRQQVQSLDKKLKRYEKCELSWADSYGFTLRLIRMVVTSIPRN